MKTPEPKFVLREPKSGEITPIHLIMRLNNERVVINTGERILPQFWDNERQRAKTNRSFLEGSDINGVLDKYSLEVKSAFRELKSNGEDITLKKVKDKIAGVFRPLKTEPEIDFWIFLENFIRESRSIKRDSTIKCYTSTLNHLKNFSKRVHFDIDFNTIDLLFYKKFTDYLRAECKMSNNTIGKQIKILKTVLNSATELGINKNLAFKTSSFKRISEDVKKIYLSKEEINKIYKVNLYYNKAWEETRDLFVVACNTGLRFSDLRCITPERIKKSQYGEFIELITNKTDQPVIIPIGKILKEILIKYNYKLPKPLSNQKFNGYLKIIGQIAGLDESVLFNRTESGKRVTHNCKKYELITAHTARRSMATNMYLEGIPAQKIMLITGHKSEKVFQKYISITQEENALDLISHSFFK